MTVAELMSKKTTISFEVFPPKDNVPLDKISETIRRLGDFKPDFFSCTFGAGGTDRGRNIEVCDIVSASGNLAMPHLICIGSSRDDIRKIVAGYRDRKLTNILALRGDIPEGQESTKGDFSHADELIAFLRAEFPDLCIGAAGYPETHLWAASPESDIAHLRSKQDNGASFVMTQLCYDVQAFERFLERIRKAGVTIPVAAGIMPVLAYDPTIRMTVSNGCSIPAELAALLGRYRNDPEGLAKAGIEYTATLIQRFVAVGVNGLHLYSMNQWKKVAAILEAAGLANREKS
ncbi:MAG: methylenetetrahydrofolate reductase [Treponema sp.]|nr:methylenetetrahydrofolate reductase [Treponema sp.]